MLIGQTPPPGFEPGTDGLTDRNSTAELQGIKRNQSSMECKEIESLFLNCKSRVMTVIRAPHDGLKTNILTSVYILSNFEESVKP